MNNDQNIISNNYENNVNNIQSSLTNNNLINNINNQPNTINQTNNNPFENNTNEQNIVNKGYAAMLKQEGIYVQNSDNKFISDNGFNETSLNDLNIEGDYNNINKVDYRNDPKVMENLEQVKKEKKTITITNELKLVIIISLILFAFIIIMPYIFDYIKNTGN